MFVGDKAFKLILNVTNDLYFHLLFYTKKEILYFM